MDSSRREFLKQAVVGSAAVVVPGYAQQQKTRSNEGRAQTAIPRWRGFNLLEMFTMRSTGDFVEDDFKWMRDWGFDFVRFPACYRLWIENGDDYQIKESMLTRLDRSQDRRRSQDVVPKHCPGDRRKKASHQGPQLA